MLEQKSRSLVQVKRPDAIHVMHEENFNLKPEHAFCSGHLLCKLLASTEQRSSLSKLITSDRRARKRSGSS